LIGQSAGGIVSQLLALDHPEQVSSLTMIGSTPAGGKLISRLDRMLLKITPSILKLYPAGFLKETIVKSVACTERGRADMRSALIRFTKAEIAEVMDGVYQGLQDIDAELDFQCPLLIIFGEFDHTGKVVAYSRQWAKITQSPLSVIPAASHNANLDNPAEFNRILSEFLKAIA
jgi:pimeloyl-ACP methyl ester carboxylesterase